LLEGWWLTLTCGGSFWRGWLCISDRLLLLPIAVGADAVILLRLLVAAGTDDVLLPRLLVAAGTVDVFLPRLLSLLEQST
jgi:hypothetical protein